MKKALEFNEAAHEYKVGGRTMLSVTKVLPEIPEHLLYKQFFIDKTHLGSRVHNYVEIINQNLIKGTRKRLPKVPESDILYLTAYRRFLMMEKPVMIEAERKMFHPVFKYAGTVDIIAELGKTRCVCDVKTATIVAPYSRLQLAAYVRLYNHANPDSKVFARKIIQLKPDGTYKLIVYPIKTLKADFDAFLCKLKSAQWDVENMKEHKY